MNLIDDSIRACALNPARSFIVEAPAGSGKTDLLVKRFLKLLENVEKPESILAITFTRKAAGEMKERILRALPEHEASLLAELNIFTIDALCHRIAAFMPLESQLLGRNILEDESALARDFLESLLEVIDTGAEGSEELIALFQYFDNQLPQTAAYILDLLKSREEWLPIVLRAREEEIEPFFKKALFALYEDALSRFYALPGSSVFVPVAMRTMPAKEIIPFLQDLVKELFTLKLELRKRVEAALKDKLMLLQDASALRQILIEIAHLPPQGAEINPILKILLKVLPVAAAHLSIILQARNETDFHEIALGAITLLQNHPGVLRYFDSEIQHILVDEFQDTSTLQFQLLQRLTQEWQEGDGRTLFLVGDPKQSIYRFRSADVGLFLHAKQKGIGALKPEYLQLSANFRASASLLKAVNLICSGFFPAEENEHFGQVAFRPSIAACEENDNPGENRPPLQQNFFADEFEEAEWVSEQILKIHHKAPFERIAILVRARSHYQSIIAALEEKGLNYSVKEDRRWLDSVFLDDLIALVYALNHPGDRLSWYSLLRSPFCNIPLQDLLAATENGTPAWRLIPVLHSFIEGEEAKLDLYLKFKKASDLLIPESLDLEQRRILHRMLIFLLNFNVLPSQAEFREALTRYDFGSARQDTAIEFLTIHQAKGLEFDHVFLPALHKQVARDEAPMLYTETFYFNGIFYFLIAERKSRGGENSPLYRYIHWLETQKSYYELMRLFYVALTRAKKSLHLSAIAKRDAHEKIIAPKRSFLSLLLGEQAFTQ